MPVIIAVNLRLAIWKKQKGLILTTVERLSASASARSHSLPQPLSSYDSSLGGTGMLEVAQKESMFDPIYSVSCAVTALSHIARAMIEVINQPREDLEVTDMEWEGFTSDALVALEGLLMIHNVYILRFATLATHHENALAMLLRYPLQTFCGFDLVITAGAKWSQHCGQIFGSFLRHPNF